MKCITLNYSLFILVFVRAIAFFITKRLLEHFRGYCVQFKPRFACCLSFTFYTCALCLFTIEESLMN